MATRQAASKLVMPTLPETLAFAYRGPSKKGNMQIFGAPTQYDWQSPLLLMLPTADCSPEQIAACPGWRIVAPLGWDKVQG